MAYYRVSTKAQGASGLGLDAQRSSVRAYLNGGQWTLVDEFTEVESGKRSDRAELKKAIEGELAEPDYQQLALFDDPEKEQFERNRETIARSSMSPPPSVMSAAAIAAPAPASPAEPVTHMQSISPALTAAASAPPPAPYWPAPKPPKQVLTKSPLGSGA